MSGEVREQTDLATWLLEQLAVDEEIVGRNLGMDGLTDDGDFPDYRTYDGPHLEAADAYLSRFSPKRMSAECDTKRRIIDMYRSAQQPVDDTAGPQWQAMVRAERSALLEVLRLMAVVYKDHPGYRDDWSPDGR